MPDVPTIIFLPKSEDDDQDAYIPRRPKILGGEGEGGGGPALPPQPWRHMTGYSEKGLGGFSSPYAREWKSVLQDLLARILGRQDIYPNAGMEEYPKAGLTETFYGNPEDSSTGWQDVYPTDPNHPSRLNKNLSNPESQWA